MSRVEIMKIGILKLFVAWNKEIGKENEEWRDASLMWSKVERANWGFGKIIKAKKQGRHN